MKTNGLKKIATLISFLMLFILSNVNAATVSGGNVASQKDADVVVDIVFAIDTSGSMKSAAQSISNAIETALASMECTDLNVWVNARLVGLIRNWDGTLFDESAVSVLASIGAEITTTSSEDNGYVVFDFAVANSLYYLDTTETHQNYVKAIVTIGDEGLDLGSPINQQDYDIGKMANAIAIENNILVFSLFRLGNAPSEDAPDLFQALAEGGATLGGHTFNDTGGTFTTTTASTPYEEVLEDVFCHSAQNVLREIKVISVLSTNDIEIDSQSFTQPPESIEIVGDETFIEWRFPSIAVDQIKNLDYDIILHNPVPGENRLITQRLEVYYTDLNDKEVHSALESQFVDILSSIFQLTVDIDKTSYNSNENVEIATQISNQSQYDQIVDVHISVQDTAGNLVEDLNVIQDIAISAGTTWQYSTDSFTTATHFTGLYQVHVQLLDQSGAELALAIAPLEIVSSGENKVSATISTDQPDYGAFDIVNLHSSIQNITPNALLENYSATISVYTPDNTILSTQTTALPQLLPGSLQELNQTVSLNTALAGNYRAELIIQDSTGVEHALSTAGFVVQDTHITGDGLTGTVTIDPDESLNTEELIINASISNIGNSAVNNLPITLSIIDPEKETILAEWTQILGELLPQQEEILQQQIWHIDAQEGGNYTAVLSIQLDEQVKYLTSVPFVLAEKQNSDSEIQEAHPIPTLSAWAIILLMLGIATSAYKKKDRIN